MEWSKWFAFRCSLCWQSQTPRWMVICFLSQLTSICSPSISSLLSFYSTLNLIIHSSFILHNKGKENETKSNCEIDSSGIALRQRGLQPHNPQIKERREKKQIQSIKRFHFVWLMDCFSFQQREKEEWIRINKKEMSWCVCRGRLVFFVG